MALPLFADELDDIDSAEHARQPLVLHVGDEVPVARRCSSV
jgi:hypothetical protein